jgi:hypothetical protein
MSAGGFEQRREIRFQIPPAKVLLNGLELSFTGVVQTRYGALTRCEVHCNSPCLVVQS